MYSIVAIGGMFTAMYMDQSMEMSEQVRLTDSMEMKTIGNDI